MNTKRQLLVGGLGLVMVAGAGLLLSSAPRAVHSQSPVELGIAQSPVVTIVLDTSASMQWTEEGEGRYPDLDVSSPPAGFGVHHSTWVPGTALNLPGSSRVDGSPVSGTPVTTMGPCMVWHPFDGTSGHKCKDYVRPPSCTDFSDCQWFDEGKATDEQEEALEDMVANTDMRLIDSNKPRHIQLKEILTGDMYLSKDEHDRVGPGCWFVPRFRGASREEQVCCENFDQNSWSCDDSAKKFDGLIDHDDPRPHYQEVYNEQDSNGLLDAMGRTTIFSVAMFDGYRFDGTDADGWGYGMNDIVTNEGSNAGDGIEGSGCSSPPCYNLGLFRFIGPTRLALGADDMGNVSAYVQEAMLNAGYINDRDAYLTGNRKEKKERKRPRGAQGDWEIPIFDYPMNKQPISMASPFAAVFHDLKNFYSYGQYSHSADDGSTQPDVVHPFGEDRYAACRPRHVVFFTDGFPEPEAPGGAGNGIGSESLNPAFGYDPGKYRYDITETAILDMLSQSESEMQAANDGQQIDERYAPRVHVLAVNLEEDSQRRTDAIAKLATMAMRGGTCAQYYLPAEMIPLGSQSGVRDSDGNRPQGTCDPDDLSQPCLVPQNVSFTFQPPDGSDPFTCDHPALLLNNNSKASLVSAFQLIFNEIAGSSGLAARTRPSITSYLDTEGERGQYRFFSGMQIQGDNVFWKGVLNRKLYACSGGDSLVTEADTLDGLHEDVNRLRNDIGDPLDDPIDRSDVDTDRRRVFTSFPSFLLNPGDEEVGGTGPVPGFFPLTYALSQAPTNQDEFGETGLLAASNTGRVLGTRVRFEHENMRQVFADATLSDDTFYTYWGVRDDPQTGEDRAESMGGLVDEYRGRIGPKADRILGAIYNSNPVTVGPPDLDLPNDGYRAFRQEYANRRTVLYVSTLDGQLHALYTGEDKVKGRDLPDSLIATIIERDNVPASEQREAWAYVPFSLHRKLQPNRQRAAQLMDGSPVVGDIRLCHANPALNSNRQACGAWTGQVPKAAQWRTVLLQGIGGVGEGYFALDVTRTGTATETPDPIVLWEFSREWEEHQLAELDTWRYAPEDVSAYDTELDTCRTALENTAVGSALCGLFGCDDAADTPSPWELGFLGTSVSNPAMGMAAMRLGDSATAALQRPIAVFGAGLAPERNEAPLSCIENITGRAIYIVDLQTGMIIRRFVEYRDEDGHLQRFPSQMIGSPALYSDSPGDVATRGFIGDARGRMFRIDMTRPDPREWEVQLFFDPAEQVSPWMEDLSGQYGTDVFGPAAYRPALYMNENRNLVVVYGLGTPGETSETQTVQAVIAVEEDFNVAEVTNGGVQQTVDQIVPRALWRYFLEPRERLTGEPVVFDGDVFFTTYVEEESACIAGTSRIYRLQGTPYDYESGSTEVEAKGAWDEYVSGGTGSLDPSLFLVDSGDSDGVPRWFGPARPTLIRGLSITLGPVCNDVIDDQALGQTVRESQAKKPQLTFTSVGNDSNGNPSSGAGANGTGGIGGFNIELEPPATRSVPLSWTIVGN
ncbi:hypothetical protein DV096_09820 [Bradymonadaceae bacterium TMQ3]|uniref:PilC beta-propeller domain-containing protein n=1 Tax=Lujinxingia sediminis TaxID=2480984 RepID=A0ABY0CP33_9DELT|nr:hypothetical protein [Lujinxingia sediminis]RDV38102.1 hypothetical protein DV096_09820 [Bradymonadaceae bacterium TMQ3]RVU42228.1 hypothetical protein EA187_16710 [Lujinxingia sediminis]TXC75774.1 hypothetical protein FRC91_09730 [Bradymonadales bacterium TMQ1]